MDPILLPVGLLMAIYTRSVKMNEILIVDDDRTVCRCLERLINWEALGIISQESLITEQRL